MVSALQRFHCTGKSQDTGKPLGSRVVNAMVDITENNLTVIIGGFVN